MLLAALTVGGPLLVTLKLAWALINVITGALVLLPGVGSVIGLPTIAVLVTAPPAGARTVTLKFVPAPLVNAGIVGQNTAPLALVVPPPVALRKVAFAGNASVTTTLVAADGPALATVNV